MVLIIFWCDSYYLLYVYIHISLYIIISFDALVVVSQVFSYPGGPMDLFDRWNPEPKTKCDKKALNFEFLKQK